MLKVYTDAAFAYKNQSAGLAIRILAPDQLYEQVVFLNQVADNHQAEFLAILRALDWLIELGLTQDFIWLHADSQVAIRAIEKSYIKDARYAPILDQILNRLDYFPNLYVKWIAEKENQAADQLAKSSLNKAVSWKRTSLR